MDGFGINMGVIVMVVINCVDILDKVLLCLGCFDWYIYLELFNLEERKVIFEVYFKFLCFVKDIDVEFLVG